MTREEAIEVYNGLINEKIKEAFEFFAPELARSEDERIRDGIIHFLSAWRGDSKVEKWLSWLEKQEEQKPAEIHIDNPNIQKFDPDVKVTTSDSSAGGKELLYVSNKSYDIGFRDGVASVKPAEWSEEDERMLNSILERGASEVPPHEPALKPSQRDWLKSLRPRLALTPVQKTALSRAMFIAQENGEDSLAKELKRIYDSAGDKPMWKPSKEQMKALDEVAKEGVLLDLFNDLLKL